MRIGQMNQDNYMEFLKLFGGNKSKSLENLIGKDKENKYAKTQEEEIDMLVKQGYMMEGTYVKEGDESWKKIIPVSDEIRNKLLDLAKSEFINNNGMTDGEKLSSLIKDYVQKSPVNERLSTGWTLSSILGSAEVAAQRERSSQSSCSTGILWKSTPDARNEKDLSKICKNVYDFYHYK